jgi:Protein of unknown function (DUF2911)
MKKLFYLTAVLLTCAILRTNAQDEPRIPGASTTQTISQDLSLGKIIITYSRPNVKDRKIFGGLQPFGEVWRTGANTATTITFTENVIIEGHKVAAGKYGLFSISGEDEWTIILNKTWDQWGAYTYKQADDLLRFTVKPEYVAEKRETFTIQFANATTQSAEMHLVWDHTKVVVHLNSDDDAAVMANINVLMSGKKKPYFDAIQYYYENGKDLNQALKWVAAAEATDPKGPYYVLWEARIRLKMGDKEGAIKAAQEGVDRARNNKDDEYERLNQQVLDKAKS